MIKVEWDVNVRVKVCNPSEGERMNTFFYDHIKNTRPQKGFMTLGLRWPKLALCGKRNHKYDHDNWEWDTEEHLNGEELSVEEFFMWYGSK